MIVEKNSELFKEMEILARNELSSGESIGECVGLAISDFNCDEKIENQFEVYNWLCANIQ